MVAAQLGVGTGIRNRLARPIVSAPVKPVSPSTGGGTAAVYHPPTIQSPPNAAQAVMEQTSSSTQLATNTETGLGIGAGNVSQYLTVKVAGAKAYIWLAALGGLLILAYAWDKGKL